MKETIEAHPEIEVIYLTYPTYEGLTVDLDEMRSIIGPDRLLIIDEAHGSHCYFSPLCPKPALLSGADAAVTSVHKTLGGLYGTSLINVGKTARLDPSRVKMQH